MNQSEKITELLSSLADAQSEFPTMPKSSKAYGYMYTDLDTITQTIKPILTKHGIGYMQSVGVLEGTPTLTTRLFNKGGQFIEDTTILPMISSSKNNAAQTLGMSITYMRRYSLCAMLGITSDEDTDATPKKEFPPVKEQFKPQTPPPHQTALKGGENTEAEKARLNVLCTAKYPNGQNVFSHDEVALYRSYRKDKTAAELIAFIENALRNRYPESEVLKK